jgi:hypothetical protein
VAYRVRDILGGYVQDGLVQPGVRGSGKILFHPARPNRERSRAQLFDRGGQLSSEVSGQCYRLNILRPDVGAHSGRRERLCQCSSGDNDALGNGKSCPLQFRKCRGLAAQLRAVIDPRVIE